jgi:hypothetical protein
MVRKLDALIRRSNRVFEFSQDPDCGLRLQISQAPHTLQLPDQVVQTGEPVLLIHLWNERLPVISPAGADLAWARQFFHLFRNSLHRAAGYLRDTPQLDDVYAVGGETILLTAGLHQAGLRFIEGMGFTVMPYTHRLGHFGEFWENFYSWLIIWTYNPHSLPQRPFFTLQRSEMWMSRAAFLQRYSQSPK